ncbi:extracellular matrix FRAS1, partial [Brachionus plicatilis]
MSKKFKSFGVFRVIPKTYERNYKDTLCNLRKLYRSNQALNAVNREFFYSDILKNQISYLLEDQGSTKDEITFKISDETFSVVYDYLIKIVHEEKPGLVVEKNDGLEAIQVDYLLPDLVIYKVLGTPEFGRIQLRFDTFYQDILGPYSFMNTFTQNDINEALFSLYNICNNNLKKAKKKKLLLKTRLKEREGVDVQEKIIYFIRLIIRPVAIININSVIVFYNHEANEPTGVTSFGFNVTDSSGNTLPDQRFTIAVRGDKLPPAIVQNRGLKVNQGQMALLSRHEFDVRDDDTPLDNLKFLIVTQPKLGRLEHEREPGRRIEFFFYQDLAYKNIHYVHEDVYNGLKNDLVDLRITDGKNDVSASVYVTIARVDNQMPLLKSKFVLNARQLQRTEISPSEIQVFDRDTPNDALKIIITHPPQYGTLERLVTGPSETKIEDQMISLNTNLNQKLNFILKFNNNQSDRKYVSVNEFTMSEIEKGRIFYRHLSQGVRQDRFGFIVYDGYNNMFMIDGGIQVSTYQIFYIDIEAERNEAPVVQKNLGLNYLHQFEAYTGRVIMKSELLITDKDNSDSDIIVEITRKPLHGFVQHKDRPGLAINRFSQHDLNHNKIYYILTKFDDQVTEDFFEFDVYDMAKNYVKQNRFDVRWSVVGFKEDEISAMETDEKESVLEFEKAGIEVQESDKFVSVAIVRNGDLTRDVQVECLTEDASAIAGQDYVAKGSGSYVRIPAGQLYGFCDIEIIDDHLKEMQTEFFRVYLRDPSDGSKIGAKSESSVAIIGPNDDRNSWSVWFWDYFPSGFLLEQKHFFLANDGCTKEKVYGNDKMKMYNLKLTCTFPFLDSSSTIPFLNSFFSSTFPGEKSFDNQKSDVVCENLFFGFNEQIFTPFPEGKVGKEKFEEELRKGNVQCSLFHLRKSPVKIRYYYTTCEVIYGVFKIHRQLFEKLISNYFDLKARKMIRNKSKIFKDKFFGFFLKCLNDEMPLLILSTNLLADECKTKYQSVTEPNSQVYVEIAREKINIAEAFSVLVQNVPTDEHYIKNYFNTNGQISGKNLSIAESGLDYAPIKEFVKFLPGEISKKIPVQIFKIPHNSPTIFTIQIRTVKSNTNKISS